ncbi:accessory factor UbiK family protein [Azonexus sp.]|uniref:accessory factor UbiK family protein n=1 Tax=Azonexus sp. TaxID=1872668 RepID=UPI0039E261F0
MFDPKILEDFGNRMSHLLANSPARDIEKNAKAMVNGLIGKLDVVTREEFDIQVELLRRAYERLEILEARIRALEEARATPPTQD